VQGVRNFVEATQVAERAHLDFFGLDEHHVIATPSSSPRTELAAAAAITDRIRLTHATAVIGADNRVRVFQHFAVADAV
jgi:alkanesulfonate monooxygenase SsuD/methylene tetrahydromethanopterin reductase-like flavin-dependent oxidoreductase (luciferase family)